MKIKVGMALLWLLCWAAFLMAQDGDNAYWDAKWSHDGQYIAVGGEKEQIWIYSGNTFELIKTIDNGARVQRLRWHPERNVLAVADLGDGGKLIDLDRDTMIGLIGVKGMANRAIAWNHTGELVAIADHEGRVTIWTAQGNLLRTIPKKNSKGYIAIDWHPAQNELIALSEYVPHL